VSSGGEKENSDMTRFARQDQYLLGSTEYVAQRVVFCDPTSGAPVGVADGAVVTEIVGVKNAAGTTINPATLEAVNAVATLLGAVTNPATGTVNKLLTDILAALTTANGLLADIKTNTNPT
jgi:hypothetical protein